MSIAFNEILPDESATGTKSPMRGDLYDSLKNVNAIHEALNLTHGPHVSESSEV